MENKQKHKKVTDDSKGIDIKDSLLAFIRANDFDGFDANIHALKEHAKNSDENRLLIAISYFEMGICAYETRMELANDQNPDRAKMNDLNVKYLNYCKNSIKQTQTIKNRNGKSYWLEGASYTHLAIHASKNRNDKTNAVFYVKKALASFKQIPNSDWNTFREHCLKFIRRLVEITLEQPRNCHLYLIPTQYNLGSFLNELSFFWEDRDLFFLDIFHDQFSTTSNNLVSYAEQLIEYSETLLDYFLKFFPDTKNDKNLKNASQSLNCLVDTLNAAASNFKGAIKKGKENKVAAELIPFYKTLTSAKEQLTDVKKLLEEVIAYFSSEKEASINKVLSGIILLFRLNGWLNIDAIESEKALILTIKGNLSNHKSDELISITLDGSQLSPYRHDIESFNSLLSKHADCIQEYHFINYQIDQNEFDQLLPDLTSAKNLKIVTIKNIIPPNDSTIGEKKFNKLINLLKVSSLERVILKNIILYKPDAAARIPAFLPNQFREICAALMTLKNLTSIDFSKLNLKDSKEYAEPLRNLLDATTKTLRMLNIRKNHLANMLPTILANAKQYKNLRTALICPTNYTNEKIPQIFSSVKAIPTLHTSDLPGVEFVSLAKGFINMGEQPYMDEKLSSLTTDLVRHKKTILDGRLTDDQLTNNNYRPIATALKKNNIRYAYNIASIFAEQKCTESGIFHKFGKDVLYHMLQYCLPNLPLLNINIVAFATQVFKEYTEKFKSEDDEIQQQGTEPKLKRLKN